MALDSSFVVVCKGLADEHKHEKFINVESSSSTIVELARSEKFVPANGVNSACLRFGCAALSVHQNSATIPKDILHDLQSLGSQFSAAPIEITEIFPSTKKEAKEHPACPYHSQVFQNPATVNIGRKDLDVLGRYLVEDPAKQYAIFHRIEAEHLSTYKNCTC